MEYGQVWMYSKTLLEIASYLFAALLVQSGKTVFHKIICSPKDKQDNVELDLPTLPDSKSVVLPEEL